MKCCAGGGKVAADGKSEMRSVNRDFDKDVERLDGCLRDRYYGVSWAILVEGGRVVLLRHE